MTTHVARDGQVFGTFEDEDLKDEMQRIFGPAFG